MIELTIRAQVESEQRRELMQMCKSWIGFRPLPTGCLKRCVYEDAVSPTCLLMIEEWSSEDAMKSYLSSGPFRALIGAVKVLGTLVDLRISSSTVIEAG